MIINLNSIFENPILSDIECKKDALQNDIIFLVKHLVKLSFDYINFLVYIRGWQGRDKR